jgi:dienelactone hydrolase
LPYFPNGFTSFGEEHIVAGFKTAEKIYLAVWCLGGDSTVTMAIKEPVKGVKIAYPSHTSTRASVKDGELQVTFNGVQQAAFIEIQL